MHTNWSRREFLASAGSAAALVGLIEPGQSAEEPKEPPKAADHTLTVISGKPRERGRQYGNKFKDQIRSFLDREIYDAFAGKPASKDEMLRYAGQCGKAVKSFSPIIFDELEGMAEATGLRAEEAILLTLHEELFHRKPLPGGASERESGVKGSHCTVLAAGPPETADGDTYVGQTWDWMASVYGLSNMLRWERPEGPSLLTYAFPGLWVGAGVSSAGLAFGWTSAFDKENIAGPRVGVPAYVLIAHLLYQESLDAVVEEAKRVEHAGWFTSLFADDKGKFVNFEISPKDRVIEMRSGRVACTQYGTRRMTNTPEGRPVPYADKHRRMTELLNADKQKLDRAALQNCLAHGDIRVPFNNSNFTVDTMLFNTTKREAYVTRGPATADKWRTFALNGK